MIIFRNKTLLTISLMLLVLASSIHAQSTLKLVFSGDIMGHDTQIASALSMGEGSYDYQSCFEHIEPYIAGADIAIGNLEVTLAGAPYKGYPAFSSPDELAVELKNVGFDILVNANNHAIDRRKKGVERTINVLDTLGIIQTGVFKNSRERSIHFPLIIEKNGIRLALLNYTYGTNGIKVTAPNIVNYIDTVEVKKDLLKAASAEVDFTIVMMHWGKEYERSENASQRKLAKLLFRNGTDAIIGSHPHVVQPITMLKNGKLVVWSTGNMISNQRKRYTDGGILIDLTLEKNDLTTIADYHYLPIWVHKPKTPLGIAFSLIPAASDSARCSELNMSTDAFNKKELFLKDTRGNLPGVPEADWDFSLKQ